MSHTRTIAAVTAASLILSSCSAMRTHYVRPSASAPATYAHADDSARASLDQWWHSFGDPQLDALVEETLKHNNDLAAAALKVRAAQLRVHLAVINPNFTVEYSDSGAKLLKGNLPITRLHSLSASTSYEVDLWGQLAALKDASIWEALATEQDRQSAELTLIGTTVDLYYQLAELNQRITLAEQSITYAAKTLGLVRALAAAGAASRLEIAQSEQSLESQKAGQTELVEQRIEVRNALTVLLDGLPWPESSERQALPEEPPPAVDAGLPASLLQRRPDLRAADLRLREMLAGTDAIRLSFYPQLSLTGTLGSASAELSKLLQNPVGILTAIVTVPFVQFNQAKVNTTLAQTQYEEATVSFRKTLVQALYDVDSALSARTQLAEEAVRLERSLEAAEEVERLYAIRYRSGAVALRFWLDAQETRRQAEIAVAGNRLKRLQNYSAICQALGGDPRHP